MTTPAEIRLYADLTALSIAHEVFEHEAVFTVEASQRVSAHVPGMHVKNLFLKDKNGRFWLVTVPADIRVALKALPEAIGCGRVSFANAEDMERLIGVTPGSVTPLAAINDSTGAVTVVIDASLTQAAQLNCHPLRNTASITLSGSDLLRALRYWGHDPVIAVIPTIEPAAEATPETTTQSTSSNIERA